VLDACAAPGGKLVHMLEIEPTLSAIAIEKDHSRITAIKENLARLKVHAEYKCADAGDVGRWWNNELFDRILLDAPCSASGVVRRHPDIKLLRQISDIPAFAKEQLHLLTSLWPLLKPGGLFLYVTCSIFPEENVDVLTLFLAEHADAKEKMIQVEWGLPCEVGRQILPGMHQMDGFYFALLRKA
jgi:16S rRNA (cytosine967-C5)-methyltransferase